MYRVLYEKKAQKFLRKAAVNQRYLIMRKVAEYALNPDSGCNVIKMRGVDAYRMRVGDWRVIFEKRDDVLLILVLDIGSRGGIYQ